MHTSIVEVTNQMKKRETLKEREKTKEEDDVML